MEEPLRRLTARETTPRAPGSAPSRPAATPRDLRCPAGRAGATGLADEEIARRLRGRDPAAFDLFYGRYARPLLGFLGGMVGEAATAEDLLQETVLRVFRHIDRYREQGTFRAWVFRIAANLALSHLRRARFAAPLTEEALRRLPEDRIPDPAQALEAARRADELQAALQRLPEEHRAVLLLRLCEGMPLAEIARSLCIAEGTVKSRLHHAVAKLRRSFACADATDRKERDV